MQSINTKTLYRKEARSKKSVEQGQVESSTVLTPEQDCDKRFQDYSEIHVEEELMQNENGGHEDLISRNMNAYFSVNLEETNYESHIDSQSSDSLYVNTESSSENEPSEASCSEGESDEEQIETQSHKKDCQSFTVLQLQTL